VLAATCLCRLRRHGCYQTFKFLLLQLLLGDVVAVQMSLMPDRACTEGKA
jgi:hypothetical protein